MSFIDDFGKTWIDLKKEAIKTNNYEIYIWFLKENQKIFTKLYSEIDNLGIVELIEDILKITTCEIKENIIKYKGMKKQVNEMTDKELLEAKSQGEKWLDENMQSKKNELYESNIWELALKRLENIEDEIRKRGLNDQ